MFSRDCAVSLLKDAKILVKIPNHAPATDILKKLTKKKIAKRCYDNYYNNIFSFCYKTLKNNKNKEIFIKKFNSMINFIESCDLIKNCIAIIPKNATVLSNMKALNSAKSNNFDLVLLESKAITPNFVVINNVDKRILALARKHNTPVYLVASIFSLDDQSLYYPNMCLSPEAFDGVVSEYGLTNFSSFITNSRKSFT